MQIRFFKPFSELAGAEEIRLVLENPISVRELWGRLEREIPPLQRFVKKEGDEVQSFFAVIVRGDEILKLNDWVQDQDTVKDPPADQRRMRKTATSFQRSAISNQRSAFLSSLKADR